MVLIKDGRAKLVIEPKIIRSIITERDDNCNQTKSDIGPVKLMSPEQLITRITNEAAAVYAFGMLAWRIVTQTEPFADEDGMSVAVKVARKGYRLPLPIPDAPELFNRVIDQSTRHVVAERPTFETLSFWLSWREMVCTIGIGLQSFELPAFVTLAILDCIDCCRHVPMHVKWDAICLIKHFHDKRSGSGKTSKKQ